MNKETINFLLKYAKIGALESMKGLDEIESEELKQEYIKIKTELTNPMSQSIESVPGAMEKIKDTTRNTEENKKGAMKKWFKGIGDRQRKYKEAHKGEIM